LVDAEQRGEVGVALELARRRLRLPALGQALGRQNNVEGVAGSVDNLIALVVYDIFNHSERASGTWVPRSSALSNPQQAAGRSEENRKHGIKNKKGSS
jgi:hypothetical protein